MNRAVTISYKVYVRVPRASGDEPVFADADIRVVKRSPRERG